MKTFASICLVASSAARHHLICNEESGMCFSPVMEESKELDFAQIGTNSLFINVELDDLLFFNQLPLAILSSQPRHPFPQNNLNGTMATEIELCGDIYVGMPL